MIDQTLTCLNVLYGLVRIDLSVNDRSVKKNTSFFRQTISSIGRLCTDSKSLADIP